VAPSEGPDVDLDPERLQRPDTSVGSIGRIRPVGDERDRVACAQQLEDPVEALMARVAIERRDAVGDDEEGRLQRATGSITTAVP
jgi:hypothetical protein